MCGNWIPDDQGSNSCSMCYRDIDHGKDGYYRKYIESMDYQAEIDVARAAFEGME